MAVSQTRKAEKAKKMTPEIYFARKLASNEKKVRDKSLKKLKRWIAARSAVPDAFTEDELLKLWKGLFYCMWMSDKPLIQEDLAETIASLIHSVEDRATGLMFFSISIRTLARDWAGIDTWRVDKFLMFMRRIIRHSLEYLAEGGWDDEEVKKYSQLLSDHIINANKTVTNVQVPLGLQLHVVNLFPEELAKAGGEDLESSVILAMLEPFAKCLAHSNDFRLNKDIRQHVFTYLIKQSDEGLDYEASGAENPKKQIRNFNNTGRKRKSNKKVVEEESESEIEEEEETQEAEQEPVQPEEEILASDDEDDAMEVEEANANWGAKDPRAGGVDVVLVQLKPNYAELADMLFRIASDKAVRPKNRKSLYNLVKWFRDLSTGVYPLAINLPEVGPGLTPGMMRQAANEFIKSELSMTKERLAENLAKKEIMKLQKRKMKTLKAPILLQDQEDPLDEENLDEEQNEEENLDEENSELEDEETLDDEEEEGEEEASDEELEEEENELSDQEEEDSGSSDEEEPIPVPVMKGKKLAKKSPPKNIKSLATFEVEDDWDDSKDEVISSPTALRQLKQKLRAGKRPLNLNGKEAPAEGDIEIVIPNKKYKGNDKSLIAQVTPEKTKKAAAKFTDGNRRVSFILDKNTAQEPKDYQDQLKKSPGVPHDPDRQPSGGVLKRNASSQAKTAKTGGDQRGPKAGRVPFRM